jgi:hypothetical protein
MNGIFLAVVEVVAALALPAREPTAAAGRAASTTGQSAGLEGVGLAGQTAGLPVGHTVEALALWRMSGMSGPRKVILVGH